MLHREFPKPKFDGDKKLLAPPLTNHYRIVGTAFDYLLRFHVHRINRRKTLTEKWVAKHAIDEFDKGGVFEDKAILKKGKVILREAKKHYKAYLKNGVMTDELIKYCYYLAQLDFIFRQKYLDEFFGNVAWEDVRDLKRLLSLVDSNLFKASYYCHLNPTFNMASVLVGGADADIRIDDIIIDVKTTKELRFTRDMYNQLIGYYILNLFDECIDEVTWGSVNRLGIYYSRFGYLYIMKVEELINRHTFPVFLSWFVRHAAEVFGVTDDRDVDIKTFLSKLSRYGIKEQEE